MRDAGDVKCVFLDRLVSTVFNIYSSRFYDHLLAWDDRNRDPYTNTIDRFIENSGGLKVMTTSPFLVGHKEDMNSTLWGFKNTQYREMIENSSKLLVSKISEFELRL